MEAIVYGIIYKFMTWFYLKKFITIVSPRIKSFSRDSYSSGKLIERERRKEKVDK